MALKEGSSKQGKARRACDRWNWVEAIHLSKEIQSRDIRDRSLIRGIGGSKRRRESGGGGLLKFYPLPKKKEAGGGGGGADTVLAMLKGEGDNTF